MLQQEEQGTAGTKAIQTDKNPRLDAGLPLTCDPGPMSSGRTPSQPDPALNLSPLRQQMKQRVTSFFTELHEFKPF